MSQTKTDVEHKSKRPPLAGIPNSAGTQAIIQPSQPYTAPQSRNPGRIVFFGNLNTASIPPNAKTQPNASSATNATQKPPQEAAKSQLNPQTKVTPSTQPTKNVVVAQTDFKNTTVSTQNSQSPAPAVPKPSPAKPKPATKNEPKLQHNTMAPSSDKQDTVNYDVMISYSHQDMELMNFVLKSLKDAGLSVWVDQEGLKAGVDFLSKIGQAIVDSTCFLQILTPASVVSKYCRDELSLAYISNKSIHVICTADSDSLFEKMDFGQKLTLAPYKSSFVDVSDVRLKKAQMTFMCDQIKAKIQKVKDQKEQKDARFLHTREKKLKSNDLTPEKFWEKYFGDKDVLNWDPFIQTFIQHFGSVLQKTVPKEDQKWLLAVFEKEICDEEKFGKVSLADLVRFCKLGNSTNCVWESVERYAREQIAIKSVFTIDSSVRLDAIENLGKFKSPAVQEALLDLLKDPDPNVRSVAALSVARVSLEGDEFKIATRVARLLKDRDRLVRESACVALGRMKAENKVPDLVNVWRNDVISVVRDAAYLALELIGGEEASKAIYVTNILSEEIKSITST